MPPDVAALIADLDHESSAPGDHTPAGTRRQHDHRLRLVAAPPPGRVAESDAVTPESCFFICHTLRCGSTLLCDALSSTAVAGYPEEYFPERLRNGRLSLATVAALKDPDVWRSDWSSTPFDDCLNRVLSSGTSVNGVFASKVKWSNMPYLGEALGTSQLGRPLAERLDGVFPNLRYIWITRRDKVRQAVSLAKARQSAEWKAMSAAAQRSGRLDYSFHVVDVALRRIVQEECAWEEYFTQAGITPITVVYEDLVRNYESTVRRLLEDLAISLRSDYAFPAPRLHKQADAVSEDWVGRYRRDARTSRMLRTVANLPALLARRRLRATYVMPHLRALLDRLRRSA
ncbi:MAG: sulfotransferase [Solirubrobacterales bacterium]|nr:sulfotransferase [Solirubrobacterales bacterium]